MKRIVRNMMGDLISTQLARACNWAGQRGPKKAFGVFKHIIIKDNLATTSTKWENSAKKERISDLMKTCWIMK